MALGRLCIDCGTVVADGSTRCASCRSARDRVKNRTSPYQTRAWRRLRADRRSRGDDTCLACGATRYVAQHHIRNVAAGGALDGATVPLCVTCHGRYEADARAGRQTPLVELVEAAS